MNKLIDTPRIINFSHWRDPLGRDRGDFEFIDESEFDENEDEDEVLQENSTTPLLVTPHGIVPIQPWNNPAKVFNFWMADTNFPITEEIALIINEVPGVEVLDVFTRYKFRVATGKAFEAKEVLDNIREALDIDPFAINNMVEQESNECKISVETEKKVDNIISLVADKSGWAICVLPNQKIECVSGDLNEDLIYKVNVLKTVSHIANAKLILSDSLKEV